MGGRARRPVYTKRKVLVTNGSNRRRIFDLRRIGTCCLAEAVNFGMVSGEGADHSVWDVRARVEQNLVDFAGGNRTRYIDAPSGTIAVMFF